MNPKIYIHFFLPECQNLKIFKGHSKTSIPDDKNIFRININQRFISKNRHDAK